MSSVWTERDEYLTSSPPEDEECCNCENTVGEDGFYCDECVQLILEGKL